MGISFNTATLLNGNGINVSALVSEITAPQTAAISALQTQQSNLSTDAGLLSGYNNDLNNLASAIAVLADPNGSLLRSRLPPRSPMSSTPPLNPPLRRPLMRSR
jgi:hypothetical protein